MSITKLVGGLLKYVRTYKEPLNYKQGYEAVTDFMNNWFDYKVNGKDNIPKTGKYIACSNHTSFIDMLILGEVFYPNELKFLAKPAFFEYESICRKAIRKMHLTPLLEETAAKCGKIITENIISWGSEKIDPKNITKTDFKRYIQLAKENYLAMFPEGHRTRTGKMQPLQSGAVLIAQRSKNPIVPVGLKGTFRFWKDFWYKKREIIVNIGEPMHPADYKKTEDAMQELEKRIKKLINE